MRSSVFTIMKKELARFFGDRRLMVSILMPGILIYVVYTFMGSAMGICSLWTRTMCPPSRPQRCRTP